MERCQKGSCDITVWIDWYLDCMLRSIEGAEEMLSSILNKAIFWQNHSQAILNDRQKTVLNIYLDGYIGKLTPKKWAKLAKVSLDTAARDIKQLTEIGILVPQVFFPAAGGRYDSSGTVNLRGHDGCYWSSRPDSTGAGGLRFDSRDVSIISYCRRAYGFSVRCVQE